MPILCDVAPEQQTLTDPLTFAVTMPLTFTIGNNPGMSIRRILLLAAGLIFAIIAAYVLELAIPKRDYFIERRGVLADQAITESSQDGIVSKRVRLESPACCCQTMRWWLTRRAARWWMTMR